MEITAEYPSACRSAAIRRTVVVAGVVVGLVVVIVLLWRTRSPSRVHDPAVGA